MDHRIGSTDLVSWQRRRTRKPKAGFNPWTLLFVLLAIVGVAGMAAQGAGWLRWGGPLAAGPTALVLVAFCAPLLSLGRKALAWLGG